MGKLKKLPPICPRFSSSGGIPDYCSTCGWTKGRHELVRDNTTFAKQHQEWTITNG